MIKMEYFCTCPICEKEIIGKNLYKNHLAAEVEETINKLNETVSDLKEYGMYITMQKSCVSELNCLVLQKHQWEENNNEN